MVWILLDNQHARMVTKSRARKKAHPCHRGRSIRNTSSCIAVRDVLNRVGDKWSVLIVRDAFGERAMRFSELKRSIEGISQRMLTLTLRGLERDGLVTSDRVRDHPAAGRVRVDTRSAGRCSSRCSRSRAGPTSTAPRSPRRGRASTSGSRGRPGGSEGGVQRATTRCSIQVAISCQIGLDETSVTRVMWFGARP